MEKLEYIRTLKIESQSVLLIFRVLQDCNLSEIKLLFASENSLILPKVEVKKGYFVWLTDMEKEEVDQIILNNSSKTKTVILRILNEKINLLNFEKVEQIIC